MERISIEKMPSIKNEENLIHLNRYVNFINSRPERDCKKEKLYEIHHMIPKSLGGSNEKSNLIKLTQREHYIAHMILWKTYSGKMTQAFYFMNKKSKSSRTFASLRNEFAVMDSIIHKGKQLSNETKQKISDSLKGRIFSEETRQKISEAKIGCKHSESSKLLMSKIKIGKKRSDESKTKQANSTRGEKNPFYGKHHSDKTKKKCAVNKNSIYMNKNYKNIRVKEDELAFYLNAGYRLGMYRSNAKGRIWVNNGLTSKMVFPNELNEFTINGFVLGRGKLKE